MEKKKQKYTREFKAEAVKLVKEQGRSQSEVSKSLGISSVNISRWVQGESSSGVVRVGKQNPSSEQTELERLRLENKRLKMEREILKKAAAFFANESV